MLCPIHSPRHAQYQAATENAISRATNEFDPKLFKPVAIAPAPPMHAAERQRLESERECLRRELVTTQRGIDHLSKLLSA